MRNLWWTLAAGRAPFGSGYHPGIGGAIVCLAMLFGAATLAAPTVAGAQDPDATIGGSVTRNGQPVDGVSVDLFTADQDGNRLTWLKTVITGSNNEDGSYQFAVTPGCYAITAIAPDQQRFTNGSQWQTISPVCPTADQAITDIEATLSGNDSGQITGAVAFGAQLVDGIQVDLFEAGADGSRGSYLRSAITGEQGASGRFDFEASAGCYVTTLIAEDGRTWPDSGSPWLNLGFCVTAGQTTDLGTIRITIPTGGGSKILEVLVTAGGSPISGVGVDIFDANADGSRGTFLDSFTTPNGPISYGLGSITGCRVLTFIAPINRTFVESGTQWLNRPFCITPDQDIYRFNEEIAAVGVTCATGAEFESVFRDDFEGAELGDRWSAYNSSGNAGYGLRRPSAISLEDGFLVITGAMENDTLVSGGMSLDLSQTYGRYSFQVRTDADPSQALSGEVLTSPTSGVHPRDGENNIYSTLVQGPTRNPFFSFIHKPFGSFQDFTTFTHDASASVLQTMTMEWTPDRISITREGPSNNQFSETSVLLETAEDLIPDVSHNLAIQLDAWRHSVAGPVRLEVDWVEVAKYCGN